MFFEISGCPDRVRHDGLKDFMDGLYFDKLTSPPFFDNVLASQRDESDQEGSSKELRKSMLVDREFLSGFMVEGKKFLTQSPSPDWVRRKIFLSALCDSAVNLVLKEANIRQKAQ